MMRVLVLAFVVCLAMLTSCATGSKSLKSIDLESDTVIMYTTDWCPACLRAKAFLNRHSIEYLEIDYENEDEFNRLSKIAIDLKYNGTLSAVPVFIVRKNILVGYSPETILWILGESK